MRFSNRPSFFFAPFIRLENLILLTICKVETLFIYLFLQTPMCSIKHICFVLFVSV